MCLEFVPKDNPTILSWQDLSLDTFDESKDERHIVSGISGEILSGQILGITSSSNATKHAVLKALGGRFKGTINQLSGKILVNGQYPNSHMWNENVAFIGKPYSGLSSLTVYETLYYSARLCLPISLIDKERHDRVKQILEEVGLMDRHDTLVQSLDSSSNLVLFGRQKLSIAIQLLKNPRILLFEEPFHGIPHTLKAKFFTECIEVLVRNTNRILMFSFDNIPNEIMEKLDRILLISQGKQIWFGTVEDALSHFERLGHRLPLRSSPSEFFAHLSQVTRSPSQEKCDNERLSIFVSEYELHASFEICIDSPKETERDYNYTPPISVAPTVYIAQEFFNFKILFSRHCIILYRSRPVLIGQVALVILSLQRIPISQGPSFVMNLISLHILMNAFLSTVFIFPLSENNTQLFKIERENRYYIALSAFVAEITVYMPLMLTESLLIGILLYLAICYLGVPFSIANMLMFHWTLISHTFCAITFAFLIKSYLSNSAWCQKISTMALLVLYFLASEGFQYFMPSLSWLKYTSFFYYTQSAIFSSQFADILSHDETLRATNIVIGPSGDLTWGFASFGMMIITIVFFGLGYLQFEKLTRPSF